MDTTTDAVECAAGIAVSRSLGKADPVIADERPWRLSRPPPV